MRFRLAAAVAALALTTACSVEDKVSRPQAEPNLELYASVSELSLLRDDSRPVGVLVRDRDSGQRVDGVEVTYASSDVEVATVSPDGEVLAVGEGTATITATAQDPYRQVALTQEIAVTVLPNPAVAIELRPETVELFVDDTLTLEALVLNATGIDLFRRPRQFWVAEGDEQVASVSAYGFVTVKAAGTARIVVASEGFQDTSTVTVPGPAPVATVTLSPNPVALDVGATATLTVTLRSWQGRVLTGRTVTFASSDELVATVDSNGVVTAVGAGTATITATSEGKTGTAEVTVTVPSEAQP